MPSQYYKLSKACDTRLAQMNEKIPNRATKDAQQLFYHATKGRGALSCHRHGQHDAPHHAGPASKPRLRQHAAVHEKRHRIRHPSAEQASVSNGRDYRAHRTDLEHVVRPS